jgi:putative ABC transport system permease protein
MPVRLMMTSCQSSTDVISLHGLDKDQILLFKKIRVKPDVLEAFKADVSGALVGAKIARRYGWKVGQNVTLSELKGIGFNVSGILPQRDSADDFLIFVGRRFLQEADGESGISHYVLVKARHGEDSADLCRAIEALPLSVNVTSQTEEAMLDAVLGQLRDLIRLSRGIVIIVVLAVLLSVGNALSMATRDRGHEFGILRTVGFPRRAILKMVLAEGALQALAGALLGCLVVQIIGSAGLVTPIATCAITVFFVVGPAQWAATVLLVVAAAVLGTALPAWAAARLSIVGAIGREE